MKKDYSSIRHKLYSAMFALREVKRDKNFNDVCLKGEINNTYTKFLITENLLDTMISNINVKEVENDTQDKIKER